MSNKNDILNEKDITINSVNTILDSQRDKCKDLSDGYDELMHINEELKACHKQLNEQYYTLYEDYLSCNDDLNSNKKKVLEVQEI